MHMKNPYVIKYANSTMMNYKECALKFSDLKKVIGNKFMW
jgi:hypothetical protein